MSSNTDRSSESTPTPLTSETVGLDRGALELEKKIFLNSPIGKFLKQKLWESIVRKGAFHTTTSRTGDFDKVIVYREELLGGWVIKGRIGNQVYSYSITDVEIQYSKLV